SHSIGCGWGVPSGRAEPPSVAGSVSGLHAACAIFGCEARAGFFARIGVPHFHVGVVAANSCIVVAGEGKPGVDLVFVAVKGAATFAGGPLPNVNLPHPLPLKHPCLLNQALGWVAQTIVNSGPEHVSRVQGASDESSVVGKRGGTASRPARPGHSGYPARV